MGTWLATLVLLAVAVLSLWFAFQRPGFVAGLAGIAARAVVKAIKPDFKKIWASKTPEEWKKLREQRDRERRGGK